MNVYNNETLTNIRNESLDIFDNLKDYYPHLYQLSKKDNVTGSFVSLLNQTIESNIMRIIVYFLKSKNIQVASIIHDGCLVKHFENSSEILLECNKFVKDHYYGFEIELVQKVPELIEYSDPELEEIQMTELKLSQMFIEYSELNNQHYVYFEKKWYYSNPETNVLWTENTIQYLHQQLTDQSFIAYCKESLNTGVYFDFAKKLGSVKGSENILHFLKIKYLKGKGFSFNQNHYLMSFRNGVFDLENNEFREHRFSDYHSIFIDYDYVKTEDFEEQLKFMDSLFECVDTRDYVLKILATCVIGKRVFEEFFVFSGVGSNGKSTLINTIKNAIGPYASEISPNFFCEKPQSSACPNPEMHESRYSRGLYMAEPEENSTFNSSKIKQYTAKSIKTRTIFETPIEWSILFTIIFACNNIPKFDDHTPAFKRRVRLVLFPFSFKEANECVRENHRVKRQFNFDDRFYNGFVNLLISYYNKFIKDCRNDNLVPIPRKVAEYTQSYFNDNDTLGQVIKDNFEITFDENDKLSRKDIYQYYSDRCPEPRYQVSPKRFYDYLRTNLDLVETIMTGTRMFKGIKLNIVPDVELDIDDDEELTHI